MAVDMNPIAGDSSDIAALRLGPLALDILRENGINTISNLVAEFNKPEPFEHVDGIGNARSATIKGALNEYAVKSAHPFSFVRFVLNRSQLTYYVGVPALLAGVFALLRPDDWSDEAATIAIVVLSLFVFDCGRWTAAPRSTRTPLSTGRVRSLIVVLSATVARYLLTENYGRVEFLASVLFGLLISLWEALRIVVRLRYVESDDLIDRQGGGYESQLAEYVWREFKRLHPIVQAAMIAAIGAIPPAVIGLVATLASSWMKESGIG